MNTESNTPEPAEETVVTATQDAPGSASAYRNLWVPLVLVPALIVVVLVLVFLAFGGIAGSASTIEEDLNTAVYGGANERTQAVFKLVRKINENGEAQRAGGEEPWETSPDLMPRLHRAWGELDEDDHQIRYVVAALLMQMGDEQATEYMRGFLELDDDVDPDGELRRNALMSLASISDPVALERAVELVTHDDKGLRIYAVVLLSSIEGPESDAALAEALGDAELEVRANAAIGLSGRGDARGAAVLVSLLDPATVEAERERDPHLYRKPEAARNVRIAAIQALGRLGRAEDRAVLEGVASGDADLEIRKAATLALADPEGAPKR